MAIDGAVKMTAPSIRPDCGSGRIRSDQAVRAVLMGQYGTRELQVIHMASFCFIEFAVTDVHQFVKLQSAFEAIKHDKAIGEFRDEEDWLEFFDDEALNQFWWPTLAEYEAYQTKWQSATFEERLEDKSLSAPSWTFDSFLFAFENGDYDLVSCELEDAAHAHIVFEPHGFPYGGTGCMHMLIEAFGFEIIGEDDGTGYRSVL